MPVRDINKYKTVHYFLSSCLWSEFKFVRWTRNKDKTRQCGNFIFFCSTQNYFPFPSILNPLNRNNQDLGSRSLNSLIQYWACKFNWCKIHQTCVFLWAWNVHYTGYFYQNSISSHKVNNKRLVELNYSHNAMNTFLAFPQ